MLHSPVKRYKRKKVFQGYCYSVVVDEVLWPNRRRITRDLIVHPGISIWVPILDDGRVVLIRQYRYGAGKLLWELPAGTIAAGESPLACAKREIEEEIGYKAGKWKKVMQCFASPGYTTEVIHGFTAEGLKPVPARPEQDEIIESKIFNLNQVRSMIEKRQIQDARSLTLLFYFLNDRSLK